MRSSSIKGEMVLMNAEMIGELLSSFHERALPCNEEVPAA